MRTKPGIYFSILAAALVFFCSAAWAWAGEPAIEIDLSLDQSVYNVGDPVGLTVTVTNNDSDLLISEGFGSKTYYLEMRVIDPAGQLILPMREEEHDEFPDTPPLAWVLYNGQHLQVADCEMLEVGWMSMPSQGRLDDLRTYYDINLPGYYSVQVQLSAVVFSGDPAAPCDVNNYDWKGVLKSETRFFYLQGLTEGTQVIPDQWSTKWTEPGKKNVEIQIRFKEGESAADYQLDSIHLNNESPHRVQALKPMLKAYFDAAAVLARMGAVQVGQSYTVYISGKYSSGESFYRQQQIRIVN